MNSPLYPIFWAIFWFVLGAAIYIDGQDSVLFAVHIATSQLWVAASWLDSRRVG